MGRLLFKGRRGDNKGGSCVKDGRRRGLFLRQGEDSCRCISMEESEDRAEGTCKGGTKIGSGSSMKGKGGKGA